MLKTNPTSSVQDNKTTSVYSSVLETSSNFTAQFQCLNKQGVQTSFIIHEN